MNGNPAATKANTFNPCNTLICIAWVTITRFFARPRLISTGCEISPTLATNRERKVWMKASGKKPVTTFPSFFTRLVQAQSRMNMPSATDR